MGQELCGSAPNSKEVNQRMPETKENRPVRRYRLRPETVATDRGEGPPLVLCHGTLMDRTMFDSQVEGLSDEYRVVAYDTRARTDQYADYYDLYDLADDCAALMDGKGIDSCVLGGTAMGGLMALRFADRYPERLDGLVLIDTTAGTLTKDEREQYRIIMKEMRRSEDLPEKYVGLVKRMLFGDTTLQENPEVVDAWVDRMFTYPWQAVHHEMDSWLDRPDFTSKLDSIDVPALVVHGEEDLALKPARSDSLVEKLDARRVIVPEAGHSANMENPAPVNEAIREFLENLY